MIHRARCTLLAVGRPPWRPISQTILDWQLGSCSERTPKELIISRIGNVISSSAAESLPVAEEATGERFRRLYTRAVLVVDENG